MLDGGGNRDHNNENDHGNVPADLPIRWEIFFPIAVENADDRECRGDCDTDEVERRVCLDCASKESKKNDDADEYVGEHEHRISIPKTPPAEGRGRG